MTKFSSNEQLFIASDHGFNNDSASASALSEKYIKQWNDIVGIRDMVYYLGNFSSSSDPYYVFDLIDRLNGDIFLMEKLLNGNAWMKGYFSNYLFQDSLYLVAPYIILRVKKVNVTLCYYPLERWLDFDNSGVHIYGTTYDDVLEIENRYSVNANTHPAPVLISDFIS